MPLLLSRPRRRAPRRPALLAAQGPGAGDPPEAAGGAPGSGSAPHAGARGLGGVSPASLPAGILIVDDDEFMRDMLPRKLRKALDGGVRILVARTPEEALSILGEVDQEGLVVLSDYDLRASMDGVQLLREVARVRPATVRILFSGHGRHEIGAIDAAAVHDFLEKPFKLDDLVPALLRSIGRAGGAGP
jgi:CheY-like chemotaxis protein